MPNPKHQIINKSQIPIFNDPNIFEILISQDYVKVWNFETGDPPAGWGVQAKRGQFRSLLFVCYLGFVICNFPASIYNPQSEITMTKASVFSFYVSFP